MAPLPVTIGVPPETTRSSWSLIKIVAGLIAAAVLARRTHPRLIAPMDLIALPRRTSFDLRIRAFQPFGHRFRILLVGLAHGLLGCEAPAASIFAHRADRQPDADLLMDQLPDRLAGPQGRSDAQPLRTLRLDRLLESLLLSLGEAATRADRPPGAPPGQRLRASAIIPRTPAGDGLLTDSQDGGDLDDRVTQLPRMHRPQPQRFEDVVRLGPSVG